MSIAVIRLSTKNNRDSIIFYSTSIQCKHITILYFNIIVLTQITIIIKNKEVISSQLLIKLYIKNFISILRLMVYYSLNSRISYIYKDIHTTHSTIHCKTEKISIVSSRIPSSKTIFLYIQRFIWKHKNIYTCYNFFTIYTINGKEDIIIRFYHSYSIPRDKYSIDEQ